MATPNQSTDIVTKDYMRSPEIVKKFVDVLGNEALANQYIQSVLILVASDEKLAACTPMSIQKSALRAASLNLSCDPALKQAWIIPYNKKQGDKWVKEAQFQPHYLGLYNLAMRTGKYWVINVSPVYEGQRVLENPLTGLHVVQETNGFVGEPRAYNPALGLVDVTGRRTKDMKIIGWIGYFKAKKGNEKSVWMSLTDIEDHAQKYVKEYKNNQNWNDPDKRQTMEMKTVLRKLLAWADLSGSENAKLAEALQADNEPETIDGHSEDVTPAITTTAQPEPDLHPMTIEEARDVIGIVNQQGKQKRLGNCDSTELNYVFINSMKNETADAAKMILKDDFHMDPPAAEKKSTEEKVNE